MKKEVSEIIIHCSDSDYHRHDDISVIRMWHKARGFYDVGYNYFIKKDGELQFGRSLNVVGAHCINHNAISIGICLSGKEEFSDAQMEKLNDLVLFLLYSYNLKPENVFGHYEFNENKTCPNLDMDVYRRGLHDQYHSD